LCGWNHIRLAGCAGSGKAGASSSTLAGSKVLPELMPHKGLVANPLCGFAYGNPAGVTVGNNEEL
jgi:hypothetical protein